jgi:hypothetical protein
MTFAKWTRPHFADDAETWSESELAPTLNGWEQREGGESTPPVLVTEPMAVDVYNLSAAPEMGTMQTPGGIDLIYGGFPCQDVSVAGKRAGFRASAAVSGMSSTGCCASCGHDGRSLKMFPDSFPATGVPISVSYSGGWMTSGTVSPGEFWTRAGSESPSGAVVCSLSAVLETRPVPRRYWLSAKAAAGILRRAAKRGKTLPPRLMTALEGTSVELPMIAVARSLTSRNERIDAETENFVVASAVRASDGHHGHSSPRGDGADNLVAFDWQTSAGNDESWRGKGRQHVVRSGDYAGANSATRVDAIAGSFGVRRLTPRECERLMAFPDDWTRYTADGTEISDSHRYRMCGNGVVATVAEWLGHRLMTADRFMAAGAA